MKFVRRPDDGIKTIRVRLPEPLIQQRRAVLCHAQKVCEGIPIAEVEPALVEGSWRDVLKSLEPTGAVEKSYTSMERVSLYNETLWEIEAFINTLMLKGCHGGVRAFYALIPGVY